MPGGWDSYSATVATDGPVGWYRFSELAGQNQDPQLLCLDSSGFPVSNGNYLQYGSAVVPNSPSVLTVRAGNYDNGAALFPSTATLATANIATGGAATPLVLQPTTAITVEAWHIPNVIGSSAKQVLVCYGSDASTLAAYNLYHYGTTASNHTFLFAVNVAGTLKVATAALPALVVGSRYHVVGVYNGVSVLIYVNGALQGTTAATGLISYASIAGLGLAFGNDPSLTDANIQGTIDEVAIYPTALGATRVAYHYRQGSVLQPFVWRH